MGSSERLSMRVAMALATGFGSGYSPLAPGTAGTVVGVALAPAFHLLRHGGPALYAGALVVAVAVAIWSAGLASERLGVKDPGQVVCDEIVGFLVAMAFLPLTWLHLAAAFVAFRVFDILKPPPCRRAEALPGGVGIVADDLLAGLYANLAVRVLAGSGFLHV